MQNKPISLRVNVIALHVEAAAEVAGIYRVDFFAETLAMSHSQEKLAAIAVDVLTSLVPLPTDDYEVCVIDADDAFIREDDTHTIGSEPGGGRLSKISEMPLQLLTPDKWLNADQLDCKYNRNGGGEHPVFTRIEWRSAVGGGDTLTGYWLWVEHQLSEI